jgi:hypothetical protein
MHTWHLPWKGRGVRSDAVQFRTISVAALTTSGKRCFDDALMVSLIRVVPYTITKASGTIYEIGGRDGELQIIGHHAFPSATFNCASPDYCAQHQALLIIQEPSYT